MGINDIAFCKVVNFDLIFLCFISFHLRKRNEVGFVAKSQPALETSNFDIFTKNNKVINQYKNINKDKTYLK